jgi:hypothetical protein
MIKERKKHHHRLRRAERASSVASSTFCPLNKEIHNKRSCGVDNIKLNPPPLEISVCCLSLKSGMINGVLLLLNQNRHLAMVKTMIGPWM